MNFWRVASNIFAVFSLLFVNFISANSQIQSGASAYDIQAGARIRVSMDNEINSKVASINDTFTATVVEPLIIREVTVLPVGTVIEGRILKVKRASVGSIDGNLIVTFETLRLTNGTKRQIEAVLVKPPEIDSSSKLKAVMIMGATMLGGIAGAVSGKESAVLIGAGIGAGAGTGFALLQKGRDARIKAGEIFEIETIKSVILPPEDF